MTGFTLIVVLFILLVIVGCACMYPSAVSPIGPC
jgi:uncharacterized protein (TIGR01732 family)